ncbi:hypothetical protein ACJRO7_010382 [Eucalyptus globulus]|uniref:Disease resistance protein RGA3 n=1 Tax=Eucalyptus globulus TaxID=34317 RepID=A0ABD3LBU9_EUCGL
MAEAVIVAIAGEIIANQVPQALEKIGKLWGVKHELEELRNIVSTLRVVLSNAEKQCYQDDQIPVWLDNMKGALYDAQDVLEEFNIEAMQRELGGHSEVIKEVRTFFSSSNQLAFNLKMRSKVRAVKKKIEDINNRRRFHLDERLVDSGVERKQKKTEENHLFIPKGVIIGRDNDKNTVMEFLLDPNVTEDVSILTIVGIGGLGKTALAQLVYNDEMASKHFPLKMWVCVSNDFDMKKIVTKILACIKQRGPEVEMEQLQHDLRTKIGGKKYLLVLDDLWNDKREEWLSLKILLVEGARESKILITTRLPLVVDITGTALSYHLEGLSESASLDLLMQMACPKEEEIQDLDKLAIGKEIVKECYGIPLVVRTIGSLLYSKKTTSEWLNFRDYELPKVSQRKDRIISILRLSYIFLPI